MKNPKKEETYATCLAKKSELPHGFLVPLTKHFCTCKNCLVRYIHNGPPVQVEVSSYFGLVVLSEQ